MLSLTRISLALLLTVAVAAGPVGCSSDGEEAPGGGGTAAPPADSPGADLVEQRCTMCHTLDRVEAADYDRAGWTETVGRMKQNGLVITAEEEKTVIDYLTEQSASK